jgi:hypothetical protein
MPYRTWARTIIAGAFLCSPLLAGDYGRIFDVVREAWPERTVAVAMCDKDANQMALIELADDAKAHNVSLIIMDCKDEKQYGTSIVAALARNPGFFLIIDEDPLLGGKGRLTSRMTYRAGGRDIPTVGITQNTIKLGAVLATGPGEKDPTYASRAAAKRMNLTLPEGIVDPEDAKAKK